MKRIFTFLLIVFTCISASAEKSIYKDGGANGGEQLWWGYFNDTDVANIPYSGNLGYSSATTIDTGFYIPSGHPIAGKGTIKAVRFWLGDDISAISSDVTLWISSGLPNKISDADYKQTVSLSSLKSRINEIELTTPFSINNGKCYVGYSFSINGRSYPVMGCGEDMENSWFYRVSGGSWTDFYGEGYGKLAMQILLEGVTLNSNSATPYDFGVSYVQKGSQANVPVKIFNYGKDPVTSIAYTISTNGESSAENTLTIKSLAFNNATTVNIPFPADNDTKKYGKTLTITKVNGVANEAANKSSAGSLITISEKPTSIPVVEEFTGTWCGWCVIGFDGMDKAKETFGDKAVLIAVHSGDPMEISDYNPVASRATGYPSSIINRSISAYPSANNLNYYINSCIDEITVGEIGVTASWANESRTSIKINTDTKFVYSDETGQYGVAFVLIEDGMTGTGSSWAQANYLSGNSSYAGSYPFWYNAASKVTGLEFNHVAVAAWNIEKGADNSIKSSFTAGEVIKYSEEVDIASKNIIQNKSKLKVVALLIDRATGNIVNAAQTVINDKSAEGVLKFQYGGKDLEENATVTINAEEDSFGFGEMNCETNPSSNPKNGLIFVTPNGVQEGLAKLEILSNTLNPGMIQWCMGGECVLMNSKTSFEKTFKTDSDGIALVQFDANNIKSEGTLEAKLTATIGSEARTVNIKFIYDKANGISVIYSEDDGAVWHDMNGNRLENAPTRKGVYIRNGKKVVR
jgi:hypothetical protein